MGTAGAKAFGDVLRVNKTLQHLNVSNNSFGRPVVGDTVRLKVNGEVKTVTKINSNDGVHVESSLSSEGYVEGYFVDADYEWESQVPAFCAGLAASSSLLSVSDAMGGFCAPVALEGDIFDMKSFSQLAVTFLCGASSALFSVSVGMQLRHGPFVCFILCSIASKVVVVC